MHGPSSIDELQLTAGDEVPADIISKISNIKIKFSTPSFLCICFFYKEKTINWEVKQENSKHTWQ